MRMTVGEMIERLEGFDREAEVQLVTQPSWPLLSRVEGMVSAAEAGLQEPENTVYLVAGIETDLAPRAVYEAI